MAYKVGHLVTKRIARKPPTPALRPARESAVAGARTGARLKPDVFVSRKAMGFRDTDAAPATLHHRATKFLEFMRVGAAAALEAQARDLAVKQEHAGVIEPSAPIGQSRFDYTSRFDANRAALAEGRPLPDQDFLHFDDASLDFFVRYVFQSTLRAETLGPEPLTEDALTIFRSFVRQAELDRKVTFDPSLWSRRWPVDDATASLLRRAARAFDIEESSVPYAGTTLDQYWAVSRRPAKTPIVADLAKTLTNYYPSLALARLLAAVDGVSAGVTLFLDSTALPADLKSMARQLFGPAQAAEARADERSRGAPPPLPFADVAVPERRQRMGHYEGWAFADGPLATEATNTSMPYAELRAHDQQAFFVTSATDANLRSIEGFGVWSQDVFAWDGVMNPGSQSTATHFDHFNFITRRLELHPRKAEVSGPMLEKLRSGGFSAQDLPVVLRLAKALELPLQEVRMFKVGGLRQTVREAAKSVRHPKHEPLPLSPRFEAVLDSFAKPLSSLDERVEGVRWLQSSAADAPGFSDLLTGLEARIASGRWAPLEWASLSSQQQDTVMEALTTDGHPAAAAVLAGLFLKGGSEALQRRLEAEYQEAGRAWGDLASRVQTLDPRQQRFVLDGVGAEGSHFVLLPLRASLATAATMTAEQLRSLYETWAPQGSAMVLRALIDWAALRGTQEMSSVRDLIERQVESHSVETHAVQSAIAGGHGRSFLSREVLRPLEDQAQVVLDASAQQRPALVAQLVDAMQQAAGVVSVDEVAAQVLLGLHRRELERVMPLDQVDAAEGGVAPKAWRDGRSLEERLWGESSRRIEVEALSSFDAVDGLEPVLLSATQTRERAPRLAHALDGLQLRMLLKASHDLTSGHPFVADAAAANASAKALVETQLGPSLAEATGDAKLDVYTVGRSALVGFAEWYAQLSDRYGSAQ